MKSIIIAAAAFAASVSAVGSAVVINNCDQEVWVHDVPAADGGGTEEDKTLFAGDTYSTEYKSLTNGCGWSIKLSNVSYTLEIDTFQFEYTLSGDTIWFDQSEINGNPWASNWAIDSDDSACAPSIQNFFHPDKPEDATGMQPKCNATASVTLTLCPSGDSSSSSASASASSSSSVAATSSVAAYSTSTSESAPTSTYVAPSTTSSASAAPSTTSSTEAVSSTTEASSSHTWASYSHGYKNDVAVTSAAASPTTFATAVVTSVSSADSGDVIFTVTEVATAYATVVETVGVKRRDVHQHHHAARHPHGGRA